mmetsp:Transcript_18806/g.38204  ORF Transcript_18806/g.38204 Transcript_18806/m.38204 type:complete len:332 (+) Transcript_18806:167-1162(+)
MCHCRTLPADIQIQETQPRQHYESGFLQGEVVRSELRAKHIQGLERDVSVLAPRIGELLAVQCVELLAKPGAGLVRLDDIIDEATARSSERVSEQPRVVLHLLLELLLFEAAEDDVHSALGTHHGDFRVGPRQVDVSAQMLRCHHVVCSSVCLACDDGELGDRCLCVCVQQLCAVLDDAAVLLCKPRQEPRDIHHGKEGNVESIAEADETRRFASRVNVEATCQVLRLVPDHADGATLEASETGDNVLGKIRLDLKEVVVIHDLVDDLMHVVGCVGVIGHNSAKRFLLAPAVVLGVAARRLLCVVQREVVEERPCCQHRFKLARSAEMCHP